MSGSGTHDGAHMCDLARQYVITVLLLSAAACLAAYRSTASSAYEIFPLATATSQGQHETKYFHHYENYLVQGRHAKRFLSPPVTATGDDKSLPRVVFDGLEQGKHMYVTEECYIRCSKKVSQCAHNGVWRRLSDMKLASIPVIHRR